MLLLLVLLQQSVGKCSAECCGSSLCVCACRCAEQCIRRTTGLICDMFEAHAGRAQAARVQLQAVTDFRNGFESHISGASGRLRDHTGCADWLLPYCECRTDGVACTAPAVECYRSIDSRPPLTVHSAHGPGRAVLQTTRCRLATLPRCTTEHLAIMLSLSICPSLALSTVIVCTHCLSRPRKRSSPRLSYLSTTTHPSSSSMGLCRSAAHAMFGDRVASNEERTLRREAKRMRRRAKWANRLSKNTAATRMVNQQALQLLVAYETIREQRYRRLVAVYAEKQNDGGVARYSCRADCSRAIVLQLNQQLLAFQTTRQTPQQQAAPPQYSAIVAAHPQQQQSPSAVAAMPVSLQPTAAPSQSLPAPPAYSGSAFAWYPTVFPHSASPSSASSYASVSSPSSEYGQLQEPWLRAVEKQTVY